MAEGVKLVDLAETDVVLVRRFAAVQELPRIIGEGYGKIMGYLSALGKSPSGIPYIAYHNFDMSNLSIEIGFPVSEKMKTNGEFIAGKSPSGPCLEAYHKGPYSGMTPTYDMIEAWMKENSYEAAGPYYEYYYNSPQEVPESELLTKVLLPVRKKD